MAAIGDTLMNQTANDYAQKFIHNKIRSIVMTLRPRKRFAPPVIRSARVEFAWISISSRLSSIDMSGS